MGQFTLHGATSHKTVTVTVIAVKTSNLAHVKSFYT